MGKHPEYNSGEGTKRETVLSVSDVSITEVGGGAERVLFEQSQEMTRRGHRIVLLARRGDYDLLDRVWVGKVEQWSFRIRPTHPVLFMLVSIYRARRLFLSICRTSTLVCIHFHQPFTALGVLSTRQSKSIRKIYTCHSLSYEEYRSRNPCPGSGISRLLFRLEILARKWVERYALYQSDAIVALSRFTRDKLIEVHKVAESEVQVIPGGIDLSRFNPDAFPGKELKACLGIDQNRVVLLTVRNLVERMGLENLLIAFNSTLRQCPDIHLVIGGEGPLQSRLKKIISDRQLGSVVTMTGFIAEDKLPAFYQMADLFVLPTKELEGFGLVTLEAMACGTPVVGTPVGGTKEIIGRFDSRFLCESTGSDEIAAKILEMIKIIKNNPKKWHEIRLNCRRFVEENYSWEKNIDSLEELIFASNSSTAGISKEGFYSSSECL